ncbi:MAG: hypothetical protein IH899_22030 [Planctomycetes bacterium]|nr:hypothetical protein [Planctomycetota bacterium]
MKDRVPLIYFFGTIPGRSLAIFPVFIVGDDPGNLYFTVAADDLLQLRYERADSDNEARREYVTRQVRQECTSGRLEIGSCAHIVSVARYAGFTIQTFLMPNI